MIAPTKHPIKSDENVSLLISASPIATNGGISDQSVPVRSLPEVAPITKSTIITAMAQR